MLSRPLLRLFTGIVSTLVVAAVPATASASVEWSADAERPWDQEWANYSCESGDRISRVSSPRAQGDRAYRIEVRDGDWSWGERCELGQANPTRNGFPLHYEGQERWISYQVRLPDAYPVETPEWNNIFQLKGIGDGGPPVNMAVRNGQLILMNSPHSSSTCCERFLWSGPASRNQWVKFTLHVKFSPNPDIGFVELYGDLDGTGQRLLMSKKNVFTMKRDGSGRTLPSHSRIGLYRNSKISGTAHAYFDGFTVATDRASAERRAFGSGEPIVTAPSDSPRVWLKKPFPLAVRDISSRHSRWTAQVRGGYNGARRSQSPPVLIQMRRRDRRENIYWRTVERASLNSRNQFGAKVTLKRLRSARGLALRAVMPGVARGNSVQVARR